MITKEIFQYFKEIEVNKGDTIPHAKFLPIRNQISIAAASNYTLEDTKMVRIFGSSSII